MKPVRSIRTRLALSATGLVLIVVAAIAGAAYRDVRRTTLAASNQRLESVSRQLSDMFGASARQTLQQAGVAARDSALESFLRRPDDATSRAASARLAEAQTSSAAAVELWDAHGQRLLTTRDTIAPMSADAARAMITLLTAEPVAISELAGTRGHLGYAVIARVGPAEHPLGFMVRRYPMSSPQASAPLRKLVEAGTRLLIGNQRGDIWTNFVDLVPGPRVRNVRTAVEYDRADGVRVLGAVSPIPLTPWVIAAESPRALALAPAHAMLWRLGTITLALLLIAAAGAWMMSATLTRPISELVTAAEGMSAGDHAQRVDVHLGDELGILGVAFNAMAERIERTRATLEHKVHELEDTEERYRLLFDSSPQPMWVYDLETWAFLAVNDAAIARYAYSREEFLAMTILEIRPTEDAPALRANLIELGYHGGAAADVWRHRAKDGSHIDVEVRSRGLTFGGRSARLVLVNDLTDRRRAEEALRATQDRLERVLGSSGAVLYELRLEPTGTVLDWITDNVTKILGYELSDVSAPSWWSDNVHPADLENLGGRPDAAAYHDGASEFRFRDKGGRYRWLREEQRLVRGNPGDAIKVVGAWIDITEQRELEVQFRQSQKMEAVGRLAGGVAHDFNNLLTIILAESHFMLTDPAMSVTEQRESLRAISEAGDRAALLTRQLLAFSRRQLIETTTLDLNLVVQDVDRMLRRLIGEDVDLRLSKSEEAALTVADRGQVEQVIVNLVVNARDAMPEGGALTIEIGVTQLDQGYADAHANVTPGQYVTLSVSDSGTGMSDDVKAHLFEPFFTTKETGKGTGLGLATCYAIAKQFGGHIGVYSEIGIGTTMRLYLPSSGAQETVPAETSPIVEGGTETILLVEDEERVRQIAAKMLEAKGYTVLVAANGADALGQIAQYQGCVDLLVTDVVLPGIGGRALAERVRELCPEVGVLFVSGYSDDVILQHRLVEHDIVLLQKPFTADALGRKVREALGRLVRK